MKQLLIFISIVSTSIVFGQKQPEDFGYKYLKFDYKNNIVEVLVQSKKGEEEKPKPIFFWCQGSLPQPVIKYDEKGVYGTFPFDSKDFLDNFHLVIIGKPGIPIISDIKNLKKNFIFADDSLNIPKEYSDKNYLDFYVDRNNYILKKLLKSKWVSSKKLVVAGHSEGSYIAAKMAFTNKNISHLIYSGGNPYGRYLNILAQSRYYDNDNKPIENWIEIVKNKNNIDYNGGDTYKCTFDFSNPLSNEIFNLKIPVLFSYGTKDWSTPYNDLFYVESIRKQSTNITFLPYIGLEHNYFPVNEKLEPNHEIYNWENVGKDWILWLKQNN
jgi:hypothetical protein